MKCPKCHYLSFDPEPRCKNCGFTLGLEDLDLAFTATDTQAKDPLADLALRDEASVPPAASTTERTQPAATPPAKPRLAPTPRAPRKVSAVFQVPGVLEPPEPATAPVTTELPLFVKGTAPLPTDGPLVDAGGEKPATDVPIATLPPPAPPPAPSPVRSAVAARRSAAPDTGARAAGGRRLGPLDRDLLEDLERFEQTEQRVERDEQRAADVRARPADGAPAVRRLGAALSDALLIAGLSTGLVWTTLRWCELAWADRALLPLAPTAGFLALVAFGYLLLFTAAGGQTIGKMLFHIRVVGAGSIAGGEPMSVRQAMYREFVALPSVLALGAGFLPALVGDGRAVHDRVAHTRVVRV